MVLLLFAVALVKVLRTRMPNTQILKTEKL